MKIIYDLFKKRYAYTMTDLLDIGHFKKKLFDIETAKDIIDAVFTNYIATTGHYYYDGAHANNLWQMIYARYKKQFVGISDHKPEDLTMKEIFDMLEPIFTRIEETFPKYELLLTKYASTNDFFAPLKNSQGYSSTNRFNDTPQVAEGYEGDSYASNYTKINTDTINTNDGNTIMARIMEVDMNYKNLVDEWSKIFFDCFLETNNYLGEDVDMGDVNNKNIKKVVKKEGK